MNPPESIPFLSELEAEVRSIYRTAGADPSGAIERQLRERLSDLPAGERVERLRTLAGRFGETGERSSPDISLDRREISMLFSLLLGRKSFSPDLPPAELLERLARSLATVFESLNRIVGVIHTQLLGRKEELETIRTLISSNLEGTERADSLQDYLDRILEAFAVAHRAFPEAAEKTIGEILAEISPESLAERAGGGLRFGPLKKAELHDLYEERYQAIRKALETGRVRESLLREFERICQRSYRSGKGETR